VNRPAGRSAYMTFVVDYLDTFSQKDPRRAPDEDCRTPDLFNPAQTWKKIDVTELTR